MSLEDARCRGMHQLFDSTHLADHTKAAAICATCPVILACRTHLHREMDIARTLAATGGGPRGTWAGQLVGKPERRGWKEYR